MDDSPIGETVEKHSGPKCHLFSQPRPTALGLKNTIVDEAQRAGDSLDGMFLSKANERSARWAFDSRDTISRAVGPGWANAWPFGPKNRIPQRAHKNETSILINQHHHKSGRISPSLVAAERRFGLSESSSSPRRSTPAGRS